MGALLQNQKADESDEKKKKENFWMIIELNGFGRSCRHDMTCQVWRRQDQRRQTALV